MMASSAGLVADWIHGKTKINPTRRGSSQLKKGMASECVRAWSRMECQFSCVVFYRDLGGMEGTEEGSKFEAAVCRWREEESEASAGYVGSCVGH